MSALPVRVGLVGAGGIAQAYAQAFSESTLATVAGVADLRPEAARSLAERLECPSYASHREMLDAGGCEAALVCTPPASHPEICLEILERGIPVLCEKPLAIELASARRMVEAAEAAGTVLTMASKFRYVEDVIRAKSVVTSGILGEIILFENSFTSYVDMSSRWNADPETSGGGVLIDNGTHSVDLIRYFLGPVAEVQAVEGKNVQRLPVEDTARIFVRSVEGVMASIDLSWSLNKESDSFIDLYGSHGTVRVGWKESKYRQMGSSDWIVFGHGYKKIQALRRQIDNFAKALRGVEPLLITAEDALASVEAVEAAYRSLKENHWIPVNHGPERRRAERGAAAGVQAASA